MRKQSGKEGAIVLITSFLIVLCLTACESNTDNTIDTSNNITDENSETVESEVVETPSDEITIYYNEFPLLNIENCSELVTILKSKDMDYMSFANKYDGRYVEFEAYVTSHTTYDGGTSHIINVTGGDYDGTSELGHYDEEYYNGLVIRIGDRTMGNSIDESVEEGQNVTVSGKIDASWCEYYKQLYVECQSLSKR